MTLPEDSIHISQLPTRFREVLARGFQHRDDYRKQTGGDPDYTFALLDELEQLMAEEEPIELRVEDMELDDFDRECFLLDQAKDREKGRREDAYAEFLNDLLDHPDSYRQWEEQERAREAWLDRLWYGPYAIAFTLVAAIAVWTVRG